MARRRSLTSINEPMVERSKAQGIENYLSKANRKEFGL